VGGREGERREQRAGEDQRRKGARASDGHADDLGLRPERWEEGKKSGG